jgi:hypothetical protein
MRVETKLEAELESNRLVKELAKNRYIQSLCQFFSNHKYWTSGHEENAYSFTIRYHGNPDELQVQKQLAELYASLCQNWIHKSKYHGSKRRYLMPMMLAWQERDSSEVWHHHGVIFFHSNMKAKGMSLLGLNRLRMFSDKVQSSDVKSLYDAENWVRYSINNSLVNDKKNRIEFGPRDTDWRTLKCQQETNDRTKAMKRVKSALLWCIFMHLCFRV